MTIKLVQNKKQKQPESKIVKEKEERHLHSYDYMGYYPSLHLTQMIGKETITSNP